MWAFRPILDLLLPIDYRRIVGVGWLAILGGGNVVLARPHPFIHTRPLWQQIRYMYVGGPSSQTPCIQFLTRTYQQVKSLILPRQQTKRAASTLAMTGRARPFDSQQYQRPILARAATLWRALFKYRTAKEPLRSDLRRRSFDARTTRRAPTALEGGTPPTTTSSFEQEEGWPYSSSLRAYDEMVARAIE